MRGKNDLREGRKSGTLRDENYFGKGGVERAIGLE